MVLKFCHFYFRRSKPSPIIPNEVVDEQEIIEVREAKPMDELCAAEEREGKGRKVAICYPIDLLRCHPSNMVD